MVESTVGDIKAKRAVIAQIEGAVSPETVIGTLTSFTPTTRIAQRAKHPGRIIGLHWAEPAHVTRFMEIVCGRKTRPAVGEWVRDLAFRWGKEPGLLRDDVPGFITNRCMYALLREALHLVESGVCTAADVDRSLRNDLGHWMALAGPFRFMDLTGIPAYAEVMKELWPDLSTATKVPATMQKLVKSGAVGVANARGFYTYTPASARRWREKLMKFAYDIRKLASRYAVPGAEETRG